MDLAKRLNHLEADSAFRVMTRAKALQKSGRDIIDMSIGQPDFQPEPAIVEAAIKALRDGLHGYTPGTGLPALRTAIAADIHHRLGMDINPDTILVCPGAKAAIFYACMAVGEKGSEIIYPDPGFLSYRGTIAFTGATPVALDHQSDHGFLFDIDALEQKINHRTRMIILNSPSNPTGMIIPRQHWQRLAELLARHRDMYLLSDEIYGKMIYSGLTHTSAFSFPELRQRTILIDGCSKSWGMTGWRVGWAVMPEEKIYQGVCAIASNCHSCVHAAAQHGAIAALGGDDRFIRDRMRVYQERRDLIVNGLNRMDGVECQLPQGAFYAFARVRHQKYPATDCGAVQNALLEDAGIAAIAGHHFGDCGKGHIRFSYACRKSRIATMLERLNDWVQSP